MIKSMLHSPYSSKAGTVKPSFLREILKAADSKDVISFAGGLPEPSLFPTQALADSAYRVLTQKGSEALQYTVTEGYFPLRKFISERYKLQQGIDIPPEQILITNGSQQALDLIGKLFLDPGDAIIMERPSYLGAIQCFNQYAPEILEVETGEEGPDPDHLRMLINARRVKFFYTIPNYQNPTGRRHSLRSRIDTASTIGTSSTYLIEDDPYGDIRFEGRRLPSLYSLLPEKTMLLGSFSKTVTPGLRLGWVAASPDIIKRLTVLKQASDLHSSNLDQQILFDFLQHNNIEEHIGKIVSLYHKRRDVMQESLKKYFPDTVHYETPQGGMFFWLKFPKEISAMALLEKSMKEGIVFVPGETFYAHNPEINTARFNFSSTEEEKMVKGLKLLGSMI